MSRAVSALVTGGAGFIGSHLVEGLVAEGYRVRVLDDLSRGERKQIAEEAELVLGDVRDSEAVASAAEGVETIFHLAAVPSVVESVDDPARTHRVNVDGTLNVFDAARRHGVRRVIVATSCAAYGDDPQLPKREEMRPQPTSPYALQKVMCEEYARLYAELYGLETVALRFFNVFGPRQSPLSEYAAVVPRFAVAALAGETMHVYGDGEQTRDFVYVGDVVRACLLAAERPGLAGERINVAGGRATTVNEIAACIASCTGQRVDLRHEEVRRGEVRHSVADLTKATEKLGYRPQVGLKEGLRRTVQSFDGSPDGAQGTGEPR